jgi:tetratricopeptide (TPR) repeat protein
MRIAAAKALAAGGRYPQALEELDRARELLDQGSPAARDAAGITLETARIYRRQGRRGDAVRAYAEVFASYPGLDEADEARLEAAEAVMRDSPSPGDQEREQARGILSGLRDQLLAERLMRGYGIR